MWRGSASKNNYGPKTFEMQMEFSWEFIDRLPFLLGTHLFVVLPWLADAPFPLHLPSITTAMVARRRGPARLLPSLLLILLALLGLLALARPASAKTSNIQLTGWKGDATCVGRVAGGGREGGARGREGATG